MSFDAFSSRKTHITIAVTQKTRTWRIRYVELSAHIESEFHVKSDGMRRSDTTWRLHGHRWFFASLSVRICRKKHSTKTAN